MDTRKLKKPDNLKEETWDQHLNWMGVMASEVESNLKKHRERVEQDAARARTLLETHVKALKKSRCTRSLFSFSNGVRPRK
jgi:hypothetical protein